MMKLLLHISVFILTILVGLISVKTQAQFSETSKIVGDYRESRAEFGTSVDFNANFIAVGASRESIAAGAVYIYKTEGENIEFHQKLTAFDSAEMAEFGGIVRFVGNQLIVASGRANIGEIYMAGALYVYELNADDHWIFHSKLTASDIYGSDLLGANPTCLDTYENTIAVGAMAYDSWKGAVYIFEKVDNEWVETQRIDTPDGTEFGSFGIGVSIFENYLIVGASGINNGTGKVYIYKKNNDNELWEFEHDVIASDAQSNTYFGTTVGVYGNQFVVGAYAEESASSDIPAAYIFEKNISGQWNEVQRIANHTSNENTFFGWNAQMKEDLLIISAPHVFGLEDSRVTTYKRNENGLWSEYFTIIPSDNFNAFFGWHFAYHGDKLLVGAPRNDFDENGENELSDAGAAFMFKHTDLGMEQVIWNQSKISIYPNPAENEINIISAEEIKWVELFSIAGEKILYSNSNRINVSSLPKGTYVVKVSTTNGKVGTQKFIKK